MGLGEDAKTEIKIHISKVVIKKINELFINSHVSIEYGWKQIFTSFTHVEQEGGTHISREELVLIMDNIMQKADLQENEI